MEDIKKRFYKKDLTIATEIDIDTRKVTSCQVFWNGTVSKYKTKKQALKAGIKHIKNEIETLTSHRETLLMQLSCRMQSHRATKRERAKITEQVLEICEALAHIQNLIKDYNKVIVGLKKEIKKEEE